MGKHLAQLNVGTLTHHPDDPAVKAFVDAIDRVNEVAERSPGFVWRLVGDDGAGAMSIRMADDPRYIVNMSVWESAESLEHFVWNTVHKKIYARKGEWFQSPAKAHFVMWWIDEGHIPSLDEAFERLEHLQRHGPSEQAFGWESLPNIEKWRTERCA